MRFHELFVGLVMIAAVIAARGLARWNFHYERKAARQQREALRLSARRWGGNWE